MSLDRICRAGARGEGREGRRRWMELDLFLLVPHSPAARTPRPTWSHVYDDRLEPLLESQQQQKMARASLVAVG